MSNIFSGNTTQSTNTKTTAFVAESNGLPVGTDIAGIPVAMEQALYGDKNTFYPVQSPCQIPWGIVTKGEIGDKCTVQKSGNITLPNGALPCGVRRYDVKVKDIGRQLISYPILGELSSTDQVMVSDAWHILPSAASLGTIIGVDATAGTFTINISPRSARCHTVIYPRNADIAVGTPVCIDPTSHVLISGLNLEAANTARPVGIVVEDRIRYPDGSYHTMVCTSGLCRMVSSNLGIRIPTAWPPIQAGFRINRGGSLISDALTPTDYNQMYTLGSLAERLEWLPSDQRKVLVDVNPNQ